MFTNKGATAALWKSLAVDFLDGIVFAQIRDKEKSAVKAFGVEKFPTIVLLPGGKIEGKVYQGKMEKAALSEFFGGVVPVKSSKEAKAEKKAASSSSKAENESSSTAEQPKATEKRKPPRPPIYAPTDIALAKAEVLPVAALADVQTLCLAKKSKTCILSVGDSPLAGVSEVYAKLTSRPPPHTFQVYNVEASGALGKELVEKLALGRLPKLVAVNHRGWYRLFSGDAEKPEQVLAWLDAIKMGEGKKEKIPASLLKEAEKAEKKTEAKKAEKKTEEEIVEEKEGKAEKAEETLSAKLGEPKVEDTSEERFEERFDIKDEL